MNKFFFARYWINKKNQIGFSLINGATIKLRPEGFSLMEVVVGIGIIAVIGVFSSTLLTRTYNSTAQTESLSNLKQNGQLVLTTLTDGIRMSDAVVCTGTWGPIDGRKNYIVIRDNLGNFTRFWFVEPITSGGAVTTNGYLMIQSLDSSFISSFCAVTTNPGNDQAVLTNTAASDLSHPTGVSVSGGNFGRDPGNEGKDTINISFFVSPSRQAYNALSDLTMQTTVKVR